MGQAEGLKSIVSLFIIFFWNKKIREFRRHDSAALC